MLNKRFNFGELALYFFELFVCFGESCDAHSKKYFTVVFSYNARYKKVALAFICHSLSSVVILKSEIQKQPIHSFLYRFKTENIGHFLSLANWMTFGVK